MTTLAISPKDLKKLESVDATRSAAVRFDTWTVAMAAMFVCGIRPTSDATEIPKSARLLEDALRRVSGRQLLEAGRIMDDWIEDHEEDLEGEISGATRVRPMDFLLWCDETLRGTPREPQMLSAFLEYVIPKVEAGVQQPASHELRRALAEAKRMTSRVGKTEPAHDFRGHLGSVLTLAYAAAESPKDRKSVFRALCELAQQQKPPKPLVGYDGKQRKVIYLDEYQREQHFGISELRHRKEFRRS